MLLTFVHKYIYILNTILQIKVLPHLIIYRAIVRGFPGGCPPWCWWCSSVAGVGGILVVAGGALVVSSLVLPGGWWLVPGGWWCLLATSPAYSQPDTQTGTPRGSSARRAVSRLNRSCKVRLIDAITLIINYLGALFGYAFTELFVG